jgi:hypothetical protein
MLSLPEVIRVLVLPECKLQSQHPVHGESAIHTAIGR